MGKEGHNSIFGTLSEKEFIAYLDHNHVPEEVYRGHTALERSYPSDEVGLGRELHVGQMVGLSLSDAAK